MTRPASGELKLLLASVERKLNMGTIIVALALATSFMVAWALEKMALEAFCWIMEPRRRNRQ